MTPRRPIRGPAPLAAAALGLAVTACSAAAYRADADLEIASVLGEGRTRVLGEREHSVVRPTTVPAPTPAAASEPAADPAPDPTAAPVPPATTDPAAAPAPTHTPPATSPPRRIDLPTAISLAFQQNRDYLSRREGLYRQGLSYSLTQFEYGPQFRATLAHLFGDAEGQLGTQQLAATLGVSQILPTGGRLSLDSGLANNWAARTTSSNGFDGLQHDGTVSLGLLQPLLRGAGYSVSHEALTQAERDLVYAIRDFELFRENFSITIAQSFFDLVSQQRTLANEETNLRQATFDYRQSEALLQVDRLAEVDVYRAKRRQIDAENRLLDARATFERARDQFKIQLGLTTAEPIEIEESEPPFEPVRYEPASAVAAALHNRLDLITERERLADTERALLLAEDGLLPNLDLAANLTFHGDQDASFAASLPDRWSASASLSMTIPLQQKPERNRLVTSQLALQQARRAHDELLDQVRLEIENQLRSLHRLEQQLELQRAQIAQEQRAVTVTEIRYESGDLDNRDLLEARQALFNAQNALIQLGVQHFVARLTLERDLGLLFVDDEGMWR